MFKFLKEKLKEGIKKISGKIDEEGVTEEKIEEPIKFSNGSEKGLEMSEKRSFSEHTPKSKVSDEPKTFQKEEKKGILSKVKEKFTKRNIIEDIEKKEEEILEEEKEIIEEEKELEEKTEEESEKEQPIEAPVEEEVRKELKEEEEKTLEKERIEKEKEFEQIGEVAKKEKKGFFQKIKQTIQTKKIDQKQFEKLFWDLEVALLENNVAVEVIDKIKSDLEKEIVDTPLSRRNIEETIKNTLKSSIEELLDVKSFNLLERIKEKKPYVICFVGINGSGKTTAIAKIANLLIKQNISVILAAADTFRAASIEQIQFHADKLGIKLIKNDYGSDPAAVAFDAIKHAKSKGIDVVLIDTAGRIHSNINLTDEMKKIIRVTKPDLKIFIGESITGNDCVEQAKKFDEAIEIDAIILSKADIDEKGGAAISVSYVTKKPIAYIGTGQEYQDIKEFNPSDIINNLGLA
ncbi:MAG: signal recognition particle-docking protein FtsY [Nanoarchaeota archaeon]|nr:signal recognition particle-docking protein FtsY [Nanoarchaeota archaeon]